MEQNRVNAISFETVMKMADEGKTIGDLVKMIEERQNE